jgi:hypothetical protein
MWCNGALTEEYRRRTYDLLALYAQSSHVNEPVLCIDNKSLQLLARSRSPLPMASHTVPELWPRAYPAHPRTTS